MVTRFSKIIISLLIGTTLLAPLFFLYKWNINRNELPILGEPGHRAGNFSFVNQMGENITQKNIEGKISIVEYFFTSCPGICKVMNKNLYKVYKAYFNSSNIIILSHTVDPDRDSVQTLAVYAERMEIPDNSNWHLLTGNKKDLYDIARKDYLLAVEDHSVEIEEDFIHTPYVSLVDEQRRIRGFYDVTDSSQTTALIRDIALLEKHLKKPQTNH